MKTEAKNLEFKVSLGNIVVGAEGRKRRRRRMKRSGNRKEKESEKGHESRRRQGSGEKSQLRRKSSQIIYSCGNAYRTQVHSPPSGVVSPGCSALDRTLSNCKNMVNHEPFPKLT